ncbi:aspartate/glutamate racemase family protein [Mycobacterium sp. 236(2023)]|uniref:aspartate/glutamate racemase family protein n=1 Tax=Mycobacterium sp. 236(2023) TaxID=3038163 RepID=UPI00241592FD|nr:aspartate/glutamate racemase family protein [Mycobacterium sp. 236(2023)]MDG4663748.1 aspartate/glutamate racemase family protein [Mycobacterium sp. 236(2023)]
MRTLGLVGGMSWVSTAEYYRLLNEAAAERLGGLHSAEILLASVDFAEIEELKLAGDWDAVATRLSAAAARLESAGADAIVLCTNTMHYVAEAIERSITVPFLHIANTTARAVAAAGLTRVGLLATAFTMEEAFYIERFASHGVEVVVPAAEDRTRVSRIIYDELCHNIIRDDSRDFYRDVIRRMDTEGVILGCTEVELLIGADDVDIPVFPTTTLHVQAAVDFALES